MPASLALSAPGQHIVVQPLGGGARPRGFFAVGASRPFSPVAHTVINAAGSLLTLALERGSAQSEAERQVRSAALELLLAGEEARAGAVLAALGTRVPHEPLVVLAADADALDVLEPLAFAARLRPPVQETAPPAPGAVEPASGPVRGRGGVERATGPARTDPARTGPGLPGPGVAESAPGPGRPRPSGMEPTPGPAWSGPGGVQPVSGSGRSGPSGEPVSGSGRSGPSGEPVSGSGRSGPGGGETVSGGVRSGPKGVEPVSGAARSGVRGVESVPRPERAEARLAGAVRHGQEREAAGEGREGAAGRVVVALVAQPVAERVAAQVPGTVGMSAPCGYDGLRTALDQARRARESRRPGVVRFADLAGQGLLALLDPAAARAFSSALLAPLTAYGSRADLVESLHAYLSCNGHWDAAAQRLGIHRHTLRYRMKRVTELLGRDLDDPGVRAELWLALQAARA
ncbi:helix-turn-helix domain-containing protein [Nonomuraea pusilla]|uniref:PucR C-terminal helix-turn-helix domain-containing protein n=1 Tax=Nonomuraea pusilla TaxID=46177 RepID=A0A1H7RR33_9ACTN|nr:helix-turn-helix domain-containing protein [Nonomuraea pusilla]SEL62750.1 PucR C-terminal helix-turn-helix domain-containing protein [Nonomuraea pusilla]